MRIALLLLLGCGLASAQAVVNDFSPTVKGVTIGAAHCYFWLKAPTLPSPYVAEAACWQGTTLQLVQAAITGVSTDESFVFPGGSIIWQFSPNAANPALIDFQISGQATADAKPVLETGTI